jgi:hypothetical protein
MPNLPDFLVQRPRMPTDAATLAAFDALFESAIRAPLDAPLDYTLPVPKWQFLCHLADTKQVLLHGSGSPAIPLFEPRKAADVSAFGDRRAVYAASDGIWPIYYAILDRDRHKMTLINSCVFVPNAQGIAEALYFFSISEAALIARAFRRGTIYVLPRDGFEQQQGGDWLGLPVAVPQWASLAPVRPLFRLEVGPEDFPLMSALRGHDDERTFARARANPEGFPWLD